MSKQYCVTLPPELSDAIEKSSKENYMTVQTIFRIAIKNYLKLEGEKNDKNNRS